LLALKPDVLFATTNTSMAALQLEGSTVPTVLAIVCDPIGMHYLERFSRPGRNVTSFTVRAVSRWGSLLRTKPRDFRRGRLDRGRFVLAPRVVIGVIFGQALAISGLHLKADLRVGAGFGVMGQKTGHLDHLGAINLRIRTIRRGDLFHEFSKSSDDFTGPLAVVNDIIESLLDSFEILRLSAQPV
jgi:hypothetical protein